jgi:hypothetical protein
MKKLWFIQKKYWGGKKKPHARAHTHTHTHTQQDNAQFTLY